MVHLLLILVFLAAMVFQTTVFEMIGGVQPDVAMLAAVYYGVRHMKIRGYQCGIFTGLVQDLFSHGIIGVNLLSKGLAGFFAGWMREMNLIYHQSPNTWSIMIIMGTLLNEVVGRIYFSGFYGMPLYNVDVFALLLQIAFNLILGIPAFFLLGKLEGWIEGSTTGLRNF